ncbi:MAG TPA: M17 family peptidase N-terminal domain-containing protein, partial [Acidimicrobiales bacterium]
MTLTFEVAAANPRDIAVVGVPVFATGPVPRQLGLSRARLTELGFEAKPGQTLQVPVGSGPSLVAVGLGDASGVTATTLRDAAAALARAAGRRASVATSLADVDAPGLSRTAIAQAVAEGFELGTYRFTAFKSDAP